MNKLMFGLCVGAMVMLSACNRGPSVTEVAEAVAEGLRTMDVEVLAKYSAVPQEALADLKAEFDKIPEAKKPKVTYSDFQVARELTIVTYMVEMEIDGEVRKIPQEMALYKDGNEWKSLRVEQVLAGIQNRKAQLEQQRKAMEEAAKAAAEAKASEAAPGSAAEKVGEGGSPSQEAAVEPRPPQNPRNEGLGPARQ